MKTSRTMILAALGCVLAASGAFAAETPAAMQSRSVTVDYSDLDLSRSAGAATLYTRLKGAARRVCGSFESRLPADFANWRKCYEGALANAVMTVDQAAGVALHRAKVSTARAS